MSISDLKYDFSFPKEMPNVNLKPYSKWFSQLHEEFFSQLIIPINTRLIVELGSWVGFSTRWFCNNTTADIICVDTWGGSAEHQGNFTKEQFDSLKDAFILSCWGHRDRIIPMQMNTIKGMLKINEYKINKDVQFVYIDASHQYEDVIIDIEMALEIFPNAMLIGDDFIWRNPTQNNRRTVEEAVNYVCNKNKLQFIKNRTKHLWAIKR